jgi:ABC-type nitrate/sulfonate/bicarbonate transport system substrate-binding protein
MKRLMLALLALTAFVPVANAQMKVRVVTTPGEFNLPLWVAQENGFFDVNDLAVTVTVVNDPAGLTTELQERRQDIAILPLDDVIDFNERRSGANPSPAALAAIGSFTGGLPRVVVSGEIQSLADLKGKRIGVDAKDSGQTFLWRMFLRGEPATEDSYTFVPLGSEPDRIAALAKRQIDATLLLPAAAMHAETLGVRVQPVEARVPYIGYVAAVSGRWVNQTDAVSGFARACVQAMDWLLEPGNRAEAAALLRKHLPALTDTQAMAAISASVRGASGYSPGCMFERMYFNRQLRRADSRGAPMEAQNPQDGIAWGIPQNARRSAEMLSSRDGGEGQYAVSLPFVEVLRSKADYQKAERALDRALRTQARMDDGTWMLEAMYKGFRQSIGHEGGGWETVEHRLADWRAAHPESVHARLAEVWYWSASAWRARGDAAASQVPKPAWELFRARLAKARAVLDEIRPRAIDNPVWHWAMLHVATAEGASKRERAVIFAEAVRREPSFIAHYTEFAWNLAPRWGGSLKEFGEFTDAAVKRTSATDGNAMYARLYAQLSYAEHDREPFKELRIPWDRMRAGYEDLLARHPKTTSTLHLFASFACRANDGKTFRALQPRLNPRNFPVSGAYTWDYCTEVLLQRS